MKRSHPLWPLWLLVGLAVAFENVWMWPNARLWFGLPVNLAYHLGLCVVASLLLGTVVRWAWPKDTDEE